MCYHIVNLKLKEVKLARKMENHFAEGVRRPKMVEEGAKNSLAS
jgi:hypothetical protein